MTEANNNLILLSDGLLIDGSGPDPIGTVDVLIEGSWIKEVSDKTIQSEGARKYNLKGQALLPGLIDCHAHACLTHTKLADLEAIPLTLMTGEASTILRGMLNRGFTTIRDAAGADWGLKEAVEHRHITGPRMFISGRALTQTGGHGDFRRRTDDSALCSCGNALHFTTRIADGVDQVRRATRDELRKGADQIKVMVSGGVVSPNDPLEACQYSSEEIRAIVDEAESAGTYVLAHAYTSEAIVHAVNAGVRSIEHANLIDSNAAEIVAAKGAFVVPTLVTYEVLEGIGRDSGFTSAMLEKLARVRSSGLESLEVCKQAGVKLGFGTDLLGETHSEQSREFLIRAEVQSPHEIIASATRINAEILQRTGELGAVMEGGKADLLVIDGNPLKDLNLLQDQGEHISMVMKDGEFYKNIL